MTIILHDHDPGILQFCSDIAKYKINTIHLRNAIKSAVFVAFQNAMSVLHVDLKIIILFFGTEYLSSENEI